MLNQLFVMYFTNSRRTRINAILSFCKPSNVRIPVLRLKTRRSVYMFFLFASLTQKACDLSSICNVIRNSSVKLLFQRSYTRETHKINRGNHNIDNMTKLKKVIIDYGNN